MHIIDVLYNVTR